MILRPIQAADVKAISSLDASYTTDRVWQMEQKVRGSEIANSFRAVRLPRALKAEPVTDRAAVTENWRERDLFLVAAEGEHVLGYLDLTRDRRHNIGWIDHVAVAPARRRTGLGSALVGEAIAWGKSRQLRSLMAETQTRNYPAIEFFEKCGFTFCGFNDRLYPQRDIVVFFSLKLD